MHKFNLHPLAFFIILFFSSGTLGQTLSFNDYKIKALHDLPAKDVNCIFKDSKGFMWIGTLDGLHRFDGYTYKSYRVEESKNSISSNMIIAIDEDSKGNIWIGTYGKGICKLDPVKQIFTNYSTESTDNKIADDVTSLTVDNFDNIWTSNWFGAYRIKIDATNDKIKGIDVFNLSEEEQEDGNVVKTIHLDKSENLWIGTNTNIKRVINHNAPKNDIQFETYECFSGNICDYKDGILSAGFTINSILPNENGVYQIERISEEPVTSVLYQNGSIWTGSRQGVSCLKQINGQWQVAREFENDFTEFSLSSNIVTWMASDDLKQIWIGTRGGGVNTISQRPKPFQHFQHSQQAGSLPNNLTRCIFEDSHENLWLGSEEKGVALLRKNKSYTSNFQHIEINSFTNEDRVYAIEETYTPLSKKHKSLIWFGTSFPVFLAAYDPVSLQAIELPEFVNNLGFVFALEKENDSTLWAGTYGEGLYRLSLNQDGNIMDYKRFRPKNNDQNGLLSYIIRSIYKDSKGNLWIGTDKGLNLIEAKELQRESPRFEQFVIGKQKNQLPYDYILQIMESKNGDLYMGTMGGGMIKCHYSTFDKTYSFSNVSTKDNLPNNSIKSIVEDHSGFLWLASNEGLTHFNPIDGTVVNYNQDDGLQDNEFSEICGLKRQNGDIIFGGINGINVFNPSEIKSDKTKPKVFLTDFMILNKEVYPGEEHSGKIILDKSIEYTKNIELDYNQNSFSVGFVGLHFNAPQKNKYRYILEGFDKQWYKASPDYRMAKYTNIPAGDYTFKVMASNCDNIWVDQPTTLKIKVYPPAYRSKWAIALYILLILIISFILYRTSKLIANRKKELLMSKLEKNKVEELSRMKLQFFTNISHEFRTPLTLINAPLNELMDPKISLSAEDRNHNQKLIKQNVNVMMRLINQLMDFRKLDQNKLKLNLSKQDLSQFLSTIYDSFTPLAINKEIDYILELNPAFPPVWFDAQKFEKVIYNLLSNAFKFTPKGGHISIAYKLELNNQILITVKDTGDGIGQEEASHVFERYYQNSAKNKVNSGGTGIGLALSKGIVELHKGKIWFSSVETKGTSFFVRIPANEPSSNENEDINQEISDYSGSEYSSENIKQESLIITSEKADSNKPKVVIAEDNDELRNYLASKLLKHYQVFAAEDGMQGLELCIKHSPELLVTDVMMPNMNGIDLCNEVKNKEEISHIPVLLLTAKNSDEAKIEGYQIGADAYIAKPFNTDVLLANMEALIKNREQVRLRFQKEIEINPSIISNSPADVKFMDNILEIIEEHLSDSDFTVEQLSEIYGVSRIYLNRKIKALTGETSNQFMRNIRLKHAAELLKQNVLNVSEVTWKVGYNDLRTFRSRFKEKFGVSPSEYAKQFSRD